MALTQLGLVAVAVGESTAVAGLLLSWAGLLLLLSGTVQGLHVFVLSRLVSSGEAMGCAALLGEA